MRDAFIAELLNLAKKDRRIILVTGDLGFGVLNDFREMVPDQFINAGVAEQNMTGIAAGLAHSGKIVFTYSIANFVTLRCFEQFRNDVVYHGLNVNAVCIGAGFSYGALGVSHHATEDLAVMRSMPEVNIIAPGETWEAGEAARVLVETPGPGYLRLDKSSAISSRANGETIQLGSFRTTRKGNDLTLIATGGVLHQANLAADILAKNGTLCRVINALSINPFDDQALRDAANETGGIVTIEEHSLFGGLGSIVSEKLMDWGLSPKFFLRIGLRDGLVSEVGSQDYLRKKFGLDAEGIAHKLREFTKEAPALSEAQVGH